MKLDHDSAIPLYLQLAHYLREQIVDGELVAGDRVPGENRLATQFGISRMTARHALEFLAEEEFVIRRAGKGTFVARQPLRLSPATVDSFSGAMRSQGFEVTSEVIVFAISQAVPWETLKQINLPWGSSALLLTRVRYVNGEPVAVTRSVMDPSYYKHMYATDWSTAPLSEAMEKVTGFPIVSSEDNIYATGANQPDAAFLKIEIGDPVLIVRGVLYDSRKVPVRTSKVTYRGDRFRLNVSASTIEATELRVGEPDTDSEEWLPLGFNMAE